MFERLSERWLFASSFNYSKLSFSTMGMHENPIIPPLDVCTLYTARAPPPPTPLNKKSRLRSYIQHLNGLSFIYFVSCGNNKPLNVSTS